MNMKSKHMAWANLIGFIVVVAMNYLVASRMLPMLAPQKEVSQMYQTVITPAGFAFSIWGVIYFLLFLAVIHMVKTSDLTEGEAFISAVTPYVWGVYVFNILWNVVFCAKLIDLSVVMIIGYWICLFVICDKIRSHRSINLIYPLAFGIHIGWITIATIVNIYAWFVKNGWNWFGLGAPIQVLVGVVLAILAVLGLQARLRNPLVPLSIGWAFFGIYSRLSVDFNIVSLVSIVLNIGTIVMIVAAVITYLKNEQRLTPNE